MDHFQCELRFANCRALSNLEDVISLAQVLPACGFAPGEPPGKPQPSPDIEALVRRRLMPWTAFRRKKRAVERLEYTIDFAVIPVRLPEILTSFSCQCFTWNHVVVVLGGLVDFEFRNQRRHLESYTQQLLGTARQLYARLGADLGWIDEPMGSTPQLKEVVAAELKIVDWVNFFGPPFVEKYGRDFLLRLPGWKTEELVDGGIFHQLTPSIVASDSASAKQLQRQVVEYCRAAGIRVRCRAPYVIDHDAGLRNAGGRTSGEYDDQQGEVPGYGSDDDFGAYLQEILATTLVLKDGTRVKPIYVRWALLTPSQRKMALAFVKDTAISEIRQHRRARLRFEFNELPDDLDRMMRDLVGEDNPGFVYTQVDMV